MSALHDDDGDDDALFIFLEVSSLFRNSGSIMTLSPTLSFRQIFPFFSWLQSPAMLAASAMWILQDNREPIDRHQCQTRNDLTGHPPSNGICFFGRCWRQEGSFRIRHPKHKARLSWFPHGMSLCCSKRSLEYVAMAPREGLSFGYCQSHLLG